MGIVISIADVKIKTPERKKASSCPRVLWGASFNSGPEYGNNCRGYVSNMGMDASYPMIAHSKGENMNIGKEELKKKITNLGLKYPDMKTKEALAYVDSDDKAYYSEEDLKGLIKFAKNNWGLVIRED